MITDSHYFLGETWEFIEQPDKPVPLSEIEIITSFSGEFGFGDREDIAKEVMDYFYQKEREQLMERTDTLSAAKAGNEREVLDRILGYAFRDSPRPRLNRAKMKGDRLFLNLGITSFGKYIGTNERSINDPVFKERLEELGLYDAGNEDRYFANLLNVSAALYGFNDMSRTTDSLYLPVGERSTQVAIYPSVPHVIGGGIPITSDEGKLVPRNKQQHIDILAQIRKEVRKETGLQDDEIGEPMFYGIIRQIPSRHYEVITSIPIFVSQEDLANKWKRDAAAKFEHEKLRYVAFDDLPNFLEEHGAGMVPAGCSALSNFNKHYKAGGVPLEVVRSA